MNRKYVKIAISAIAGVLLLGGIAYAVYELTHKQKNKEQTEPVATMEQTIVEVDTIVLRKQTFQKQMLCNGKLVAIHRAELMCPNTGE